ncbi:MAG: MaoC family dehydratase [Rhodocyclaceae bacterium]|nr:MaoC family dehydratase [Rhodocyclaceae bacterium]
MSSPFTFDTIASFVGREIGATGWETVSQARIDAFAECTGDRQWIHVDAERARRESPFGTTIAHGFLTLSTIADGALELLVEPLAAGRTINCGVDKVRFIAPVRADARIRSRFSIASAVPKGPDRLLITLNVTVEIAGEEQPALTGLLVFMVSR